MTELGRFRSDINTWRAAIAASSGDNIYNVFCEAAGDFGAMVNNGLDRQTAVDMLMQLNEAYHIIEDIDEVENVIVDAFEHAPKPQPKPKPKTNGQGGQQQQAKAPQSVPPHAYVFPEASSIPRRGWLYGFHYIRGSVVATVAPGGFGKTTLALYEALEMVRDGKRVWYISGEDDLTEITRRIAAHCKQNNRVPEDFGDRLFVDDKITFPFKIARSSKNGPDFDTQALKIFEDGIVAKNLDVIILDPFVGFHFLAENDTSAMDALVKRLGDVCIRRKCCVELSHHVRKPGIGQFEITVYDARGAAAIVNAVRSCRVINQMSIIEAQQMQKSADERMSCIRVDSGKRNMAPPEKARWLQLKSVEIANGDKVQAIDDSFEFKPIETAIEDEVWVKLTIGDPDQRYRADSRSEHWFGHEVGKHWGRSTDGSNKGDIIWVQKQIKKWLVPRAKFREHPARGPLIRKVERQNEQRKKVPYFELVEQANGDSAPVGTNE
jgi:hypothetical protein